MERLSKQISTFYENSSPNDKFEELKVDYILSKMENSSTLASEALNFTNLEFSKLISLFENNEKLLKDYFKFGLYNLLSRNNMEEFFAKFSCPNSAMENVLDFIIEVKSPVREILIF